MNPFLLVVVPLVWVMETSSAFVGRKCDDLGDFLEETAETLHWLAAVTRVVP